MAYKDNGFPLKEGFVNRTAGDFGGGLFWCVADGQLDITWKGGATDTVLVTAGAAVSLGAGTDNVTIVVGTFHVG